MAAKKKATKVAAAKPVKAEGPELDLTKPYQEILGVVSECRYIQDGYRYSSNGACLGPDS